jgi:Uma2 family endonuclease
MSTVVIEETVRVPAHVSDLASFRRWALSDDFPESGRISYLNGEVWVDMSREQIFSHNQIKTEYAFVLQGLAKTECPGRFLSDGVLLTNSRANLSTQPDGTFVSRKSLRQGKLRWIRGAEEGYVELKGTPDMVLEVVGPSSVQKDTILLPDLYWQAGILEYWLVDVRTEPIRFDILRRTATGYQAVRKQGGWLKSAVFGKSFKLKVDRDELGDPEYTLLVR